MISCDFCIRDFNDLQTLNQHLKTSLKYVNYKRCQRDFNFNLTLKQHLHTLREHKSHN